MPYRWLPAAPNTPRQLEIWPHQSLAPRGFVWMIGATAALFGVPLLVLLTTPAFWALLPFPLGAIAALWFALRRSRRDRQIREVLTFGADRLSLSQTDPQGRKLWSDNPYWVEVRCHAKGGPVEDYLTLRGPNGREVEIGAFLGLEERQALFQMLRQLLPQR